ncbi:hypothetical protein [Mesorhizobium australicum]|uniref:hypothetical protein n=1 Tax=Mesorhizobium australicum TaxID=536018 RepID=UPI003337E1CD
MPAIVASVLAAAGNPAVSPHGPAPLGNPPSDISRHLDVGPRNAKLAPTHCPASSDIQGRTRRFCLTDDTCGVAFAGALDAMENTRPFYTDASMKTLKPMPEFKVPFMAMPQTKREMMIRECQDATMSKPYAEFCADVNALAGS